MDGKREVSCQDLVAWKIRSCKDLITMSAGRTTQQKVDSRSAIGESMSNHVSLRAVKRGRCQ